MRRALALALLCAMNVACSGSERASDDIGEWEGSCWFDDRTWEVEVGIVDVVRGPFKEARGKDTGVVGWGALFLGEDARYAGELRGESLEFLRFPFTVEEQAYRVSLSAYRSGGGEREGDCELESDEDYRSGELLLRRSD